MAHTSTTTFGDHPWMGKIPFELQLIEFTPRWRAATQILITVCFVLAIYAMYQSVEGIVAGVGSSGLKLPADVELPTWALLVIPLAAIIPGLYVFFFLKYNFLQ